MRSRQDSRFVCQTQLTAEQLLHWALCCPSFSSFQWQPESQTSTLPLVRSIFVCDEGRICQAACQCGLASGFARLTHSSLIACQPVWQSCLTTPVLLRLQKPRLQILRACQPARAFPLVGRTRCHTATLSLLAKFLSRFALLSSILPFSLIFSLCLFHSSFLCWQHTPSSCPGSLKGFFTFIILVVCERSCMHTQLNTLLSAQIGYCARSGHSSFHCVYQHQE